MLTQPAKGIEADEGQGTPRRYGRYELLFPIASGGMAEVHAARLTSEGGFQKLVALKRMHKHLAEDEQFVSMFLDEARLAANIVGPHVVGTIDLGRAGSGELYMVMELVVGASLSQLLRSLRKRDERIDMAIGAEIIAQAALGLDDAHRATEAIETPS
jgi:serine/threonine-protein kinase